MMLTQGKLDSLREVRGHEVPHREVRRREVPGQPGHHHEAHHRIPRAGILHLDLDQALLDMEVQQMGIN